MPESPRQPHEPPRAQFPLFDDGPFNPLHISLRLTGTERRQVRRRIITAVVVTWVPLLVLAAAQGHAIGPSWRQSMLFDPAMYARYLVALPLLILSTAKVRRKVQAIVHHFLDAGLVRDEERQRFHENITSTLKWRDSWIAAVVIAVLAIAKAAAFGLFSVSEMADSWRVLGTEGHRSLSLAGWWQVAVCDTLYDVMVLLLLYRLALWWRFLWRTSRLDLRLNAAHPDGAAGLAFLGIIFSAFRVPFFAISASAAGALANLVLHVGVSFADFRYAIGAFVVGLVAIVTGPFLFFNGQLRSAKERATLAGGTLAGRQLRAFEEKWWKQDCPGTGEMLSAADFSAVGDLGVTVATARNVNTLPFRLKQLVQLVVAALLPFLPVAAIETPLKEILTKMLHLIR